MVYINRYTCTYVNTYNRARVVSMNPITHEMNFNFHNTYLPIIIRHKVVKMLYAHIIVHNK